MFKKKQRDVSPLIPLDEEFESKWETIRYDKENEYKKYFPFVSEKESLYITGVHDGYELGGEEYDKDAKIVSCVSTFLGFIAGALTAWNLKD